MFSEKIYVITGGNGPERMGSLASGRDVVAALTSLGYEAEMFDLADVSATLNHVKQGVVFLTTHGWYGEDGKLQGALDLLGVPYLGSGVTASAVSMFKPLCLHVAQSLGIITPRWTEINPNEDASVESSRLFNLLGPDIFVKPSSGGGSLEARAIASEKDLICFLQQVDSTYSYIASTYIRGTDVSVSLLDLVGEVTCLPMLATHHDSEFYDYEVKHNAALRQHSCPADIPDHTKEIMESAARNLFHTLKCRAFARFDFMVDDHGTPWFLEINTLPGMSRAGNLATMANAANISYSDLIQTLIGTISSDVHYHP
ncbi:ATP-grasp domain-containing protein [Vibrio mimicus]|uniref:D-alanine--D-alanine ligase family protein n=1 Tax=Vibrio mimicus TaxID=674 RepID=UPI0011D80998|nr:ATP-grasp domain-containing protein [Vibrio mimicus]TXY25972.1 ATP-grasp domain-containing protein [Vibrio mimicus]